MVEINDLVVVQVQPQIEAAARWFAERRLLYEFPGYDPAVFGNYGPEHVERIYRSILAEMSAFDYLHQALDAQFGHLQPRERSQATRDLQCLHLHLGCFDAGYDLTIAGLSADVKNYGTATVDIQRIMQLNLLVSQRELAGRRPADIYIQTFNTDNGQLVLAGYYQGLPQLDENFPTPAYACPVRQLQPMSTLRNMMLNQP